MNESEERCYMAGEKSAWLNMLKLCIKELGYSFSDATVMSLITERDAAIVALRDLCETNGDNDWPDDLYLADIIEKHVRHGG